MLLEFEENSCLLLIDIQQAYSDVFSLDLLSKNIPKLLSHARKKNVLISHIFEIDDKKKSLWLPFWEELKGPRTFDKGRPFSFSKPLHNEAVFIKNGYDAFFKTQLDQYLKKNNIKTLYICGLLTGVCVLNSVFTAFNKGYRIILLENCCSDRLKTRHNNTLKYYSNYLFIKNKI